MLESNADTSMNIPCFNSNLFSHWRNLAMDYGD